MPFFYQALYFLAGFLRDDLKYCATFIVVCAERANNSEYTIL